MKNIFKELIEILNSGKKVQAASLIKTEGSAPQTTGSMAIIENGKVILGTIGGGIMEMEAQNVSLRASKDNTTIFKKVNFNSDISENSGSICGGTALFIVDSNPQKHKKVYSEVLNSLKQNKCGFLISVFQTDNFEKIEINKFWIEKNELLPQNISNLFENNKTILDEIQEKRKSLLFEFQEFEKAGKNDVVCIFVEPIFPAPKLIIAGAGHIGQALCNLSATLGFETIIIDNRPELANKQRFQLADKIVCQPFDVALSNLSITPDTYIVIATQGHRSDIEVLRSCIHSSAAYIGVIGSKRKSLLMEKKFIDEAWALPEEWNFINSPVGLDIHAKTVNEIALSIAAELVKVKYELNFKVKRKKVTSIILAAGKSTRMGQQKLLLPYHNSSIIRTIATISLQSFASETKVVLGSDKLEITRELKDLNLSLIENREFEKGMLSSVQAGVSNLKSNTDGFLILLGDQPMISTEIINRLIIIFQKSDKGLIIPSFRGKRGHPVLISSKYKNEILKLNPDIGLRELFQKNDSDILEVEIDTENILKDIDTPEDYNVSFK